EHTGRWMTCSPEWKDWLNTTHCFLWIHGIPGAGKTVLLSYLIQQAKESCGKVLETRNGWCYYYCYHGRAHDETTHLLRWILNQLCRQVDYIPDKIYDLYQEASDPTQSPLMNALGELLKHFQVVFLLVDVLDESKSRENLHDTLLKVCSDARFQKDTTTSNEPQGG
ncbi:hypothetical protein B0J14DRAFT_493090, partial [Halenospora varia]